ncbi:hypothetical protein IQ241_25035 [Romeria aff. gracilis LEGE 07310]|uniref:Uncharacterized protein n=1 Tax=Vasconcelosia minhoensis LEGE 07310 TaxID=915328 RepID=A0A8J7AAF4_9CYAN|nr:hypothetical protein [Romeria gracilis]MBE9080507.1 hypothetical protein [Romeria aff. gracilis LEGE 07310]
MFKPSIEYVSTESVKVQQFAEALKLQQAAQDFRREVEYREAFEQYCQWYYHAAQQTQQEFAATENDVNFFGWFCSSVR